MENVKQFTDWKGTTHTTIQIGTFLRDKAEQIKAKLDGKTFMNFEICIAPIGGMCNVFAETSYDAEAEEILGMFIFTMACEL